MWLLHFQLDAHEPGRLIIPSFPWSREASLRLAWRAPNRTNTPSAGLSQAMTNFNKRGWRRQGQGICRWLRAWTHVASALKGPLRCITNRRSALSPGVGHPNLRKFKICTPEFWGSILQSSGPQRAGPQESRAESESCRNARLTGGRTRRIVVRGGIGEHRDE